MAFPYSLYRCACAGSTKEIDGPFNSEGDEDVDEEEEETFNPKSKRSNFSLYPLDHLMWCEDCHDIRCSRCTIDEIVCWYCPSCLFEVPSSMVKSEGNR
jgi:dynactin-4